MMGVQLAALLLAGRGAAWAARLAWAWIEPRRPRLAPFRAPIAVGVLIALLAPAWLQLASITHHNATEIARQRRADATQGADVDRLLAVVKANGDGRVYAGLPTNSGSDFLVGTVPVYQYLEWRDADEVGYTSRTASLMSNPETRFDEFNASHYVLFGASYVILPAGEVPSVQARHVLTAGAYALWAIPHGGYVHAGSLAGTIAADRTDIGARTRPVLESTLPEHGVYVRVDRHGTTPLPRPSRAGPGTVDATDADLERGRATATVRMPRPGVAVLSASYDTGWRATVDGRPAPAVMVAPALVATRVPAGVHRVAFRYAGYGHYPELFALGLLTLLGLAVWDRRGGWSSR
jgi:hypothetical protein